MSFGNRKKHSPMAKSIHTSRHPAVRKIPSLVPTHVCAISSLVVEKGSS